MKTSIILPTLRAFASLRFKSSFILIALMVLGIHSAFAGNSLSSLGKLQLFVDGKRVPVTLPQDEKLYALFSDLIQSGTVLQNPSSDAGPEVRNVESTATRLIFTANKPFRQEFPYGQHLKVKRILVSIPKTHLPQILVVTPKKTIELSVYSRKALIALIQYPKINKPILPQYKQLESWTPQKKSSNNAPYN
ncbi:MAG: hypothetical protein ABI615_08965 [Chthoniobacterales bacterium]